MNTQYYRIADINLAIQFNEVLVPKKLEYSFAPFGVDSLRDGDDVLKVKFSKRPVQKPSFLEPYYTEEIFTFCTWFGTSLLFSNVKKAEPGKDEKKMGYCYYSCNTRSNSVVCSRLDLSADEAEIIVWGEEKQGSNYCQLISMALWAVFGTWALKHNRIFLHSSVTVVEEKAILFLGESGIGKSTQSQLWQRYIPGSWLLNDDSPMIFVGPNKILTHGEADILVYGTPWSGKTACYHSVGVPIAGIVRLTQGASNQITPLNGVKAFVALQPSAPPMLSVDEKLTDYVCNILSDLITKVDCNHMVCTPTREAVVCLYEKMIQSMDIPKVCLFSP